MFDRRLTTLSRELGRLRRLCSPAWSQMALVADDQAAERMGGLDEEAELPVRHRLVCLAARSPAAGCGAQSLRITPMFLLLELWMKRLLRASSVFCGVNCGL